MVHKDLWSAREQKWKEWIRFRRAPSENRLLSYRFGLIVASSIVNGSVFYLNSSLDQWPWISCIHGHCLDSLTATKSSFLILSPIVQMHNIPGLNYTIKSVLHSAAKHREITKRAKSDTNGSLKACTKIIRYPSNCP